MEISDPISEPQVKGFAIAEGQSASLRFIRDRLLYAIYALTLAVSISVWFIAIRAPLWLDETVSYFLIKGGFSEIMPRQGWPDVPIYSYILWLWAKIAGTSEVALRASSLLAMLGAVYLLCRAARELFDWDVAIIAAVIFCLHPIVIFASIDVRPYAFGVLVINASIFVLVCLRHNNSNWLAAVFGALAACIVYFHFLMIVILPALAICFIAIKIRNRKALWRQAGVALAAFALAFLPEIPGVLYMFRTGSDHVFAGAPTLAELSGTLTPGWLAAILGVTLFAAAVTRRLNRQSRFQTWQVLFCASLGLVPILILYGVSAGTSIHVFLDRYRLVAIPGIALCWAFIVSRIDSRALRLLFCITVVATTAYQYLSSPSSKHHLYTWKYALEFAQGNASVDNAPVLMCSDLPEADHMPMPLGEAVKDSAMFAQLSYYKLSVPVVGLPRALNAEAMRVGSSFVQEAAQRRERFLALAYRPSYGTLDWLTRIASQTYDVRVLAQLDGIVIREFRPRAQGVDQP